jgi:hypothetical protein
VLRHAVFGTVSHVEVVVHVPEAIVHNQVNDFGVAILQAGSRSSSEKQILKQMKREKKK